MKMISKTLNFNLEKFISVHGSKYNYDKFTYLGSKVKSIITCKIHGDFLQSPEKHGSGRGCPKCAQVIRNSSKQITEEKFRSLAKEKHGDKYNYEWIENTTRRKDYVLVICPIHGKFKQLIADHLSGCQCSKCSAISRSIILTKPEENISYDREKYLIINRTPEKKLLVLCKRCTNKFEVTLSNFTVNKSGCPRCSNLSSTLENTIEDFLVKNNINYIRRDRSILDGKEIDFLLPDFNLGIECHGLYWHCQKFRDKNYHRDKMVLAKSKGIRLIQIFEDEIVKKSDIVFSRLRYLLNLIPTKIYGRQCIIKEVSNIESSKFLAYNHIQDKDFSKIRIGLYYKDELVSLMTFCNLRKSLGNNAIDGYWELSRFCNKLNTTVVGGANKLLKYFEKVYNPLEVISYADLRWSCGKLYEILDFTLIKETKPNYWYILYLNRYHRYGFRKNILAKKLTKFDPNLTEQENMVNNKYNYIYDCGNLKYTKSYS